MSVGLIPTHVPAYAGKISSGAAGKSINKAHPRAYGENAQLIPHDVLVGGLIPAHTGNAFFPVLRFQGHRAHSRAYGERT